MKILMINKQDAVDIDMRQLKKISEYIANKFDADKKVEMNVVFVDKEEIRKLNKKYRNKNNETDVLSFAYGNSTDSDNSIDGDHILAGEIVISPEVASLNSGNPKRPAFECWDLRREIVMLITHGILHIYSFDHEEDQERARTEGIQTNLLKDVFSQFDI